MQKNSMKEYVGSSYLSGNSAAYLEALYEQYLADPASVDSVWKDYFDSLQTNGTAGDTSHEAIREQFRHLARRGGRVAGAQAPADATLFHKQAEVMKLVNAYRSHGHHLASLDPLGLTEPMDVPDLKLETYGLSSSDLSSCFDTASTLCPDGSSLSDIFTALQTTYCGSIGIEYMHISDNAQIDWIQQHFETVRGRLSLNKGEKERILRGLTAAEGLEKYLGAKYVGQKRFSLEGGDSLIPLLDELIQRAGSQHGAKEVIIGMAHRGRLNVLVNILGKAPEDLFSEFEGKKHESLGSGDVKYHMGFSSDVVAGDHVVHLALAFNPSHLEIISPVVEGSVRARQRRRSDEKRNTVLPVIIHGDAAMAGQGVVMETFNLSKVRGYTTGGTVHIVVNNQVGFTTNNPLDSRSTFYCTDVAKMIQAPILHVNADDPEAVIFAIRFALDFRMKFNVDVVIDLVCYRRHGHNEADEPAMTQPVMYQTIKKLPTTRTQYADRLVAEGELTEQQAKQFVQDYRAALDAGKEVVESLTQDHDDEFATDWRPYLGHDWMVAGDTSIAKSHLVKLADQLATLPDNFSMQPQVKRLYESRLDMAAGKRSVDWGFAETLAYASLLDEGYPIRISGQDCGRGTFGHRHAVMHDFKTGEALTPLKSIASRPGDFVVIDSVLSEEAVLAYEYGYATAEPRVLTIWEAQFGDFANGAQVVIDQFISSGDQKWGRLCGLVMLLPHGYEGMGPEHSSARLERYLQLCAQYNMQVCVPSTPAQCFHMLRRQMIRPFRKPLVVMSPKSLLRHKLAVSSLEELAEGEFQVVIPEVDDIKLSSVRRVVLCSGKVYYDLLEKRREEGLTDVAIIRVEQLYPFPYDQLTNELKRYSKAREVVWCQEEPRNQGAWYPVKHRIQACLSKGQTLSYAGRMQSASPAVGYASLHKKEQETLVLDALMKG